MNVTELNLAKRLAAVSFVLALGVATEALSAQPLTAVGTLSIPATGFGSSAVLSWSWGLSNSGTAHVGGGGGAGKANIQDLSLTRYADGQSPMFFKYVAEGRHLETVVLVDGSTTIALGEVLITAYSLGNGGSPGPSSQQQPRTENITLNFARVTYTVNGVSTCFNIEEGTSC